MQSKRNHKPAPHNRGAFFLATHRTRTYNKEKENRNTTQPGANMPKATAPKGHESNPIHQSDLTEFKYSPGKNVTWAKTALGTAIHNIIKSFADAAHPPPQAAHILTPPPTTTPNLEQEFNKAIQELQMQGTRIIYTKEDQYNQEKKQTHKRYLLQKGKEIIRKVKQLIDFKKLSIVGTEVAFKFLFPPTNQWFAGSADLIITVHPDRFTPRVKKPEHFYAATANIPELEYNPNTPGHNLEAYHLDELPIIWDYKTTITPTPLSQTYQHHIYSLAAKYGFWTRKAVYNTDEHTLDFSKSDDWFFFNTFAPFYYVFLWGLTSKSSPASGGISVTRPKRLRGGSRQQTKVRIGVTQKQEMFQYAFPGMDLHDAAIEAEDIVREALADYSPE